MPNNETKPQVNKFKQIVLQNCMDPDLYWLFILFFLMIPISRMIPRIVRSIRNDPSQPSVTEKEVKEQYAGTTQNLERTVPDPSKRTRDMQVLGSIHQGANTFEKIQRSINIENKDLESILTDLETRQLIKVHEKRGMFGVKVELYTTDKGFKEYYS